LVILRLAPPSFEIKTEHNLIDNRDLLGLGLLTDHLDIRPAQAEPDSAGNLRWR